MIDKYQLYMVYKNIKKMWNSKRFNTAVFRDFFDNTMDDYVINQFVQDGRGVEYMSNYLVPVANEINCSFTDLRKWTMYVMMKCLVDRKFPEARDVSSVSRLSGYAVFAGRPSLGPQFRMLDRIIEERNGGFEYFTDRRFSLYETDAEQKNQAYRMYAVGELDPEFYIQGLYRGAFAVDQSAIRDTEYGRFVAFSKMIVKLQKEISDKNKKPAKGQ